MIRFGTIHNNITKSSNITFYCDEKKNQFKNQACESQQHTIDKGSVFKNIVHPH